jgi:hypothetical protein
MMAPENFVQVNPSKGIPQIAFLMPVYQQAQFVAAAIESVLGQKDIVAEIIVSDDASTDGTFAIAEKTIRQWLVQHDCPHRIIVRRGHNRLWRDHLPLLVEAATCDVVCQAHGDDISHQLRGKILLNVFGQFPKATLVASQGVIIDSMGVKRGSEKKVDDNVQVRLLRTKEIIPGHPDVVGFSQAWRRHKVAKFPRLDRSRAAVAHDRILPFRAAIVGEVYVVNEQLVLRRHHPMAAHKLMFHEPGTQGKFAWNLTRLVHLSAMLEDLEHAVQSGMVNQEQGDLLVKAIHLVMAKSTSHVVGAYREQMLAGRQIAWVDDDVMIQIQTAHRAHI